MIKNIAYYGAALATVVLIGGGCGGGSSADVTANDIETDAYLLPISDESIIPEPQGVGAWRIQNFVSSDDPKHKYADDAFFIEISSGGSDAQFAEDYGGLTDDVLGLGNNAVKFGDDGVMGGDTWPHDVYYHEASKTTMTVYAQTAAGKAAAHALLDAIYWY